MPTPAIFFDDGRGLLAPLRDLRPIFAARTGAFTTLERWQRTLGLSLAAAFVPDGLRSLAEESAIAPVNTLDKAAGPVLVINGRCPVPPSEIRALQEGGALIEAASGEVIAAHLDAADALTLLRGERPDMGEIGLDEPRLITRPWHVITFRDAAIAADMALLASHLPHCIDPPAGVTCIGTEPPRVHASAKLYPGVTLNTEAGPIAIDEHAVLRPGAIINGPVYIGRGSTVLEQSLIKANTAIGPVCKVAGEIGGTIIQGYSNKAHDGHLGDSWLGEWVNLGAGTTNSNLLNTYGEVTAVAEPHEPRERTGLTFFGCVLGDHVKTAISTRIMTGSIVHTGAMWADDAAISGCVDRFTWATPKGHQKFRMDKFEAVMRAATARRKVEPSVACVERIVALA